MSSAKETAKGEEATGQDFVSFLNQCCTPFHAIAEVVRRLEARGYKPLSEKDDWKLEKGGKYYITRNQSAIIAFAVGGQYATGNGFTIMAAHSDQPVLKLKPVSKMTANGFLQLAIECYGGGLWHTWFDRDLSVAGRVLVALPNHKFESRLVRINRPIVRVPSLAIHMNRAVNDTGFLFNLQQHLAPVLATTTKAEGDKKEEKKEDKKEEKKEDKKKEGGLEEEHHSLLLQCVAKELNVAVDDIRGLELMLYDTQPAQIGGLLNEFVYARGLDNLLSTYTITRSFLEATCDMKDSLAQDDHIRMMAVFDNEEVGSQSTYGAQSDMLKQVVGRIVGEAKHYDQAISRSFLVSSDTAHAVNPNYADKHDERHKPQMQKGLVIKTNTNQRYATTPITAFFMQEVAKRHDVPLQKFAMRNDMPCGTTIGPILATSTSIRAVDVGVPQWSMHSIREACGVTDVHNTCTLLTHFYDEFPALDKATKVDA